MQAGYSESAGFVFCVFVGIEKQAKQLMINLSYKPFSFLKSVCLNAAGSHTYR